MTGSSRGVDHADDAQVRSLFARVTEDYGHLDLLVNNVSALPPDATSPPPFWTKSPDAADQITVGLRSAYVATDFAAPLLLASDRALLVAISYYGSVSYHLDPAYGARKAGLDKMTWDMAQDFRQRGVAVVSVWPGPTSTERSLALSPQLGDGQDRTGRRRPRRSPAESSQPPTRTPTSSGAPATSSSEPRRRSSTDSGT